MTGEVRLMSGKELSMLEVVADILKVILYLMMIKKVWPRKATTTQVKKKTSVSKAKKSEKK